MHIVGLGFDANNAALVLGLERTRGARRTCPRDGRSTGQGRHPGAYEGPLHFVGNPNSSRARTLRVSWWRQASARTPTRCSANTSSKVKPGFVPHRWASLGDAVRWITQAGGAAVIAHPASLRYRLSANEEFALFSEFKQHGGQAVEVVTGSHSAAEAVSYAAMAQEFGLAASRGSDLPAPTNRIPTWARCPAARPPPAGLGFAV